MILAALLAAACASASGQTQTGPNRCERPDVSAVIDGDMGVSLVWEVRPEVEAIAISPAPASAVVASAGSVALGLPVGGGGTWHVRAVCRYGPDEVWQSSHATVSLGSQEWIAALAARPVGLPVPGGLCISDPRTDQQPRDSEGLWGDHHERDGWRVWTYYHRWEIECPGWSEPLVVLGRTASGPSPSPCRMPGGHRPDTLPFRWQSWGPHPEWAAWADRHPTADRWCWDGKSIVFELGRSGRVKHTASDHGHDETPPTRSVLPD